MAPQQWAALFACATVIAVLTGLLAWRRRHRTRAAVALAVTMAGVATWSAGDALITTVESEVLRWVYPPVLMIAVGLLVAGIHALSQTIKDPSWRPSRRMTGLLVVEPVVVAALAALPATRDLVIVGHGATGAGEQSVTFGPVFAAHCLYAYTVITGAYVRMFRQWRTAAGIFRRQIGVLLAAALFATVGSAVTVSSQLDGQIIDVSPLFFAVSGLVDCWALLRLGFLRLVPVAREQVVDTVPDAVLVVDPHDVLIDLNPAARRMLAHLRPRLGGEDVIGRPLAEIAGDHARAVFAQAAPLDGHRLAEVAPGVWLDVRDTPVGDPRGRSLGRIVVIRDVSEQQARQAAVETLNRQLAEQLQVIELLRAELAEEAVRDPLTGLHNRRHLDRLLAGVPDGSEHQPAVIAVDIDHFKDVNDRFGHAAGDAVLGAVARVLQAAVREGDTAVRLGGEEFLVVLPGAGRDQAVRRAEDLRRDVAAAVHDIDGRQLRVTISAGVAVRADHGGSAEDLLEAADRALYTAKATGRNRVVAADAAPDVTAAGLVAPEPVLGR